MRIISKPQISLFCQWTDNKISKELQVMAKILDRHPEFSQWVHKDLINCKIDTGNIGMSSEQVLRAAIIKNVRKLSYRELAFNLSDSLSTRAFLMLDIDEKYSSSCLQCNISKISDTVWEKISKSLVIDAQSSGFEKCKKVRIDSTVTDSNIEYPTDSKLLYDCIRVIDREFKKARKIACKKYWRLSSREDVKEAKRLRYKINNSKNDDERLEPYEKLIRIAKNLKRDLPGIITKIERKLEKSKEKSLEAPLKQLTNVNFYLEKVIYQAVTRIIKKQTVPSLKKIVSIFEPHTDIIVKDKRETQFGHKIFITSGDSNMVLHCEIPRGNPNDSEMFMGTLNALNDSYGRYPSKVSADGGFASQDNVKKAKKEGVKDVCFPKKCNMKVVEMVKSDWVYKKLLNWRAGIEAVISFLKRCFGLNKASWKGFEGFKKCLRCGIASYNLLLLARNEMKKT